MLPEKNIKELVYLGETRFNEFKLKIIPKKLFTISKNKHTTSYYDLAQFYETSLEIAAKTYCKEDKNEDNLDRNLIGTQNEYWEKNLSKIIKYCKHDAKLCNQLAEYLRNEINNSINFNPKTYISKAGITKQYFRNNSTFPQIQKTPLKVLKSAFETYRGGRFEVLARGYQGIATEYDIVSAYPNHIKNLININKGEWKKITDKHKNAKYGYYLAKVEQKGGKYGSLPYREQNTIIYPIGTWHGWYTKNELEWLELIGNYEIITGYEFYPTEISYPFKEAINKLYSKKEASKKGSYEYKLYKILMNSLYGAFYEKIKQPEGKIKSGQFFNPIYASEITSQTRTQLLEFAEQKHQHVLSFATDSIIFQGNPKIKTQNGFGEFEKEETGKTWIIRSGIFSIGEKMKQRGVMTKRKLQTPYREYENIFEYIKEHPELSEYPIQTTRPIHSREAIIHNKKYKTEDINIFKETEIKFDLNTEIKRHYKNKNITGKEILEQNITSTPYKIINNAIWTTQHKTIKNTPT